MLTIAALVASDDDSGGGGEASSSAHVSLTEFAITPEAVTVGAGGTIHVTNDGTAVHNLSVADTDLRTPDIPAGETGELDVSSLEPGSYEILCLIPGHADSGMTGTLEVTEGGGAAAGGTTDTTAGAHARPREDDRGRSWRPSTSSRPRPRAWATSPSSRPR